MAILCFDIGGTNIKSSLFQNGHFIDEFEIPASQGSLRAGQRTFLSQLDLCIQHYAAHRSRITALHVALPGPFKSEDRDVLGNVKNLPLKDFFMKRYLERRYKLPVILENDANCFAYGEYLKGKAKSVKNLLGITLGTGFGVGIIVDGKIVHGKGNAGENGHAPYLEGTVEDYVSKRGIIRLAKKHGFVIKDPAEIASKKYQKVWDDFGYHLGRSTLPLILALDPSAVVFGGKISKSWKLFEKPMKEVWRKDLVFKAPKAVFSTGNLAFYGVAMLDEGFSP